MTEFNTMEAVERGDSYIFIKRDMGKMTWYITGFWTWFNLPDKGIFFIKAYPKNRRYKRMTKRDFMTFKPKKQTTPLQAWADQEVVDTLEDFWDYVDAMGLNSKVLIQSRIYLEARQVLKKGSR